MAMVGLHTIRALFIEALQTASSTRSVVLSFFSRFAWLFLLPLAIYILSFVAHLWLLPYTDRAINFTIYHSAAASPSRRAEAQRASRFTAAMMVTWRS